MSAYTLMIFNGLLFFIFKALRDRVLSSLILLSNCSQQALEYHEFDNATKVMKVLFPYLKSTDLCIRMTAHGVAVHLGVFSSPEILKVLELTQVEINELVKALGHAIISPTLNVNVFSMTISAKEILSELNLSMVVKSNLKLLLKTNIFDFLPVTLKVNDTMTLEAAIYFILTIAIAIRNNEIDLATSEQLSSVLKSLSVNNTSISNLTECAIISLKRDLLTGRRSVLDVIYACIDRFWSHRKYLTS